MQIEAEGFLHFIPSQQIITEISQISSPRLPFLSGDREYFLRTYNAIPQTGTVAIIRSQTSWGNGFIIAFHDIPLRGSIVITFQPATKSKGALKSPSS